jgi:hypothetical protein
MIVFSSKDAAIREGFQVDEFDCEHRLFIVVKDMARGNMRVRMRAFAKASAEEIAQRCPQGEGFSVN